MLIKTERFHSGLVSLLKTLGADLNRNMTKVTASLSECSQIDFRYNGAVLKQCFDGIFDNLFTIHICTKHLQIVHLLFIFSVFVCMYVCSYEALQPVISCTTIFFLTFSVFIKVGQDAFAIW